MSDSTLKQKVAVGASWMVFLRLTVRCIGVVSMLVLARLLLPGDFGLVALATTIAGAVEALGMIGLQLALVREEGVDRAMYDTAFSLTVIRGALTGLIVAAAAPFAADFFADDRLLAVLLVIAVGAVVQSFENIGIVAFRKDFRFDREVVLFLSAKLSAVVVTIGCALVLHNHWALVIGIITSRLVRLVMSYTMHPYRPRFAISAWRRLLGVSVWIWIASIAGFLRDQADAFVIGRALGMAEVGIFRLGTEIASLTTSELVQPVCRALLPGFSRVHNAGKSITDTFVDSFAAVSLLVLPAAVGMGLVADPLVHLALGPNWGEAVAVIRILCAFALCQVAVEIGSVGLLAIGRPDTTAWIVAAVTPARLALLGGGVWLFGLNGGAWALGLGGVLEGGLFLVCVARYLPGAPGRLAGPLGRNVLACGAMAAVLLAANGGLPVAGTTAGATALTLFGNALSGAAVFMAVLLGAWLVSGRPAGMESTIIQALKSRLALRRLGVPAS